MLKSANIPSKTNGKARSPKWAAFRKKFLQGKVCNLCGGTKKLEAHHIQPFHLHPELELQTSNLLPLCESGHDGANHHLLFGHLGDFKSINVKSVTDSKLWNGKIKTRPYSKTSTS